MEDLEEIKLGRADIVFVQNVVTEKGIVVVHHV